MNVYILENAFFTLLMSSIEVYPKECLGLLVGSKGREKFVVNQAVVFQTAERTTNEVFYPRNKVYKEMERFLKEYMPYLSTLGDFHSHPYRKLERDGYRPSDGDIELMEYANIYIIVQIHKKRKRMIWNYNPSEKTISGTIGDNFIKISAWTRSRDNETRSEQANIICRPAVGLLGIPEWLSS
jgi:proteasome lid subunit RPN8/RPN11